VDAALYLTELQAEGVLGAVGVTNFDTPRLQKMIDKGAAVVSNQVGVCVVAAP
jgi:diketogulonate reductase-like aldo/keto reductase